MRALRRGLQIAALAGTLIVGVIAIALIVSQTPWFRDWLRRYIVREAKTYLNGDLSIGGLGGNLFFGVQLGDVALDMEGERILAIKDVELEYSIFRIISSGVVLDRISLNQPSIILVREDGSWNFAHIVKPQRKEADREGPGRPIALPSIQVTDGTLTVRDADGTGAYRFPERITDLDLRGGFAYEPVRFSVDLEHVSFRATAPTLTLGELSGRIAVRDDNLHFENLVVRTAESALQVDGVVEQYLRTPVIRLTTTGNVSLPEIGRVVPAIADYNLRPSFTIRAEGPTGRLAMDLDVRTASGTVVGQVTANVQGPSLDLDGDVNVQHLDLAPILNDPAQRSDITGHATFALEIARAPETAPVMDRMRGTFSFRGPSVTAAGYSATSVDLTGRLVGRRIELDGRANAYGGSATTKGFIVTPSQGRALAFDLSGRAEGIDLRNLPASVGAPRVETNLSVASYTIRGTGGRIEGTAELRESTMEGATLAEGTRAEFRVEPRAISYSAQGQVADLDLERVGRASAIAALAKPEYASRVNGEFDVSGSLPRRQPGRREGASTLAEMTLVAAGRLKDSEIMGGRLPDLGFETHLTNGALNVRVDGSFENFDPARIAAQPRLEGTVSGAVTATLMIVDLTSPITPERIAADGQVALVKSTVAKLDIDNATIDAEYVNGIANVRTFTLHGPDLDAEIAGTLATGQTGTSNLQYRVNAVNIPGLARLAGQEGIGGSATLEGTVTGDRVAATVTGTLKGSNLSYNEHNALDLTSTYTITIPDLDAARARVDATTEASFVKAAGLEINQVTATTTYEDQTIGFTAHVQEEERSLDARGEVILHTDHQELHLPELVVRTQGVEWRTRPGTETTIRYGQNRVELQDVQLVSADQSLSVDGTIALGGEVPAGTLDVTAQNVDLQQLERLLLQERGLSGRLSANATLTGTTAAPMVSGHVEILDGGVQTYRYESLIADVDYKEERFTVDATLTQTPAERITVTGSAPLSLFRRTEREGHVPAAAGDEVDLRIRSTALGLGFVQGFTDQLTNVSGTFEADVRVTGSGDDPHIEGHIDIRDGAFGVPAGGVSYTGLNTRIDLTPDLITIQSFSIIDEEGAPLNVSGSLAVHERKVGAVNITLDSENFEIIDNELGDVGLKTAVRITGELRRPKVEGRIEIATGRIEVDRLLALFYDPYARESISGVVSAEQQVQGAGSAEEATRQALERVQKGAAPAGETPGDQAAPSRGLFDAVELDLTLVIPQNLVLRGSDIRPGGPTRASVGDINITIGGNLEIDKAPGDQVRLVGTVETIRGTYEFQGRRFDLVRGGELQFVGDDEVNPFLDITATRMIPNVGVEARIHITGTLRTPELELSSNPPLEESDILALIVFNRPVNELGSGERSSLAATAGGIATGFLAAPLGESIGRALDLDLFEITTTTDSGDFGAGITVGQQIGDRAFLRLRQQFGQQSTSEFLVEYQLARFLRLQLSAAPETTGVANRVNQRRVEKAGLDLIFFFSY